LVPDWGHERNGETGQRREKKRQGGFTEEMVGGVRNKKKERGHRQEALTAAGKKEDCTKKGRTERVDIPSALTDRWAGRASEKGKIDRKPWGMPKHFRPCKGEDRNEERGRRKS